MSLQEKLVAELKSSMLAKNADRTAALRMLKSALGYAQIEKKTEILSDAEVVTLLQKEAKKRRDAMEEYGKAGREDLVSKEKGELAVVEEFLPKALSESEIEALVKAAIQEVGATSKKEMGVVMKAAQAKAAGRADGKILSQWVGRLLP